MYDFLYNFFHNDTLFFIETWVGVLLSIILIVFFIKPSNRDERGWKIFGKASLATLIYFLIIVNFLAYTTGEMSQNGYVFDFSMFGHILQFIYNSVILVEVVVLIVFKVRE